MKNVLVLLSILVISAIAVSLITVPVALSKPGVFPNILGRTSIDPKPNGCVNCHQSRPEIGRDLRLSILLLRINNHTDTGNKVASSEIPIVCKDCHSSNLGNLVHMIHLGYVENLGNNSTASYKGECFYCHTSDSSAGKIIVKTGFESKP